MTRLVRRICACLAIASLAFAQLAVSAYACPAGVAERALDASAAMANDCEGLANRNLCEQHCDYGASSVQSSPTPGIAPELVPLPWRAEPFVPLNFSAPAREWLLPTRIEAPLLVRFGFLRI